MIVLTDKLEKEKYRNIESSLFNFDFDNENLQKVIKKEFIKIQRFNHDLLGHKDLFYELQLKFAKTHPEFCIATIVEEDPIYLFNLSKDTLIEYYGVLNHPKSIGLNYPDPNVGYSVLYEELFIYNTSENWCLYSNRYYDTIILAY